MQTVTTVKTGATVTTVKGVKTAETAKTVRKAKTAKEKKKLQGQKQRKQTRERKKRENDRRGENGQDGENGGVVVNCEKGGNREIATSQSPLPVAPGIFKVAGAFRGARTSKLRNFRESCRFRRFARIPEISQKSRNKPGGYRGHEARCGPEGNRKSLASNPRNRGRSDTNRNLRSVALMSSRGLQTCDPVSVRQYSFHEKAGCLAGGGNFRDSGLSRRYMGAGSGG